MSLSENELNLLEQYLDGESDPAQSAHVRSLIAGRDDAAEALRLAKAQRGLRSEVFQQQGDDDDAAVDRILSAVHSEALREKFAREDSAGFGWRQWTGLAAACLALGFFGVFIGYATGPAGNAPASITPYSFNVQVVNDAGQITRVIPAADFTEAKAVAEQYDNAHVNYKGMLVTQSAGL